MLKPKAITKCSHSGNTTTEYALIGCMICLVSLTGLLSLSGAFSASVSNLKANMKASVSAAKAGSMGMAATTSFQNPSNIISGNLDPDAIDVENNGTATTGANGDVLGSTVTTSDNSTSDLAVGSEKDQALVANIANTAFEIARFQQVLEQLSIYSNGNTVRFRNSSVVVDGKKMTASQLAIALGNRGLSRKIRELLSFVNSSGLDEEVKAEVRKISTEVQNEAKTVSDTTSSVLIKNSDPALIEEVSNSEETEENASQICDKAGEKNDGNKCG